MATMSDFMELLHHFNVGFLDGYLSCDRRGRLTCPVTDQLFVTTYDDGRVFINIPVTVRSGNRPDVEDSSFLTIQQRTVGKDFVLVGGDNRVLHVVGNDTHSLITNVDALFTGMVLSSKGNTGTTRPDEWVEILWKPEIVSWWRKSSRYDKTN